MLRQLFIVAHHFPEKERNDIRFHIYQYLDLVVTSTTNEKNKNWRYRSRKVDEALVKIEDSMFVVSKKYPDIGPLAFGYLTRAMEFREQKLHNLSQRLPNGIRFFVVFSTFSVVFGSLFLPFSSLVYNYYFTLILAFLAFGVFLLIEDFDYPYRPGIHHLSVDVYVQLKNEVKEKLDSYSFNIEKAEEKEKNDTFHQG